MDCAWCGNGEGICDEHMAAIFAQSAEIAASGQHLANTWPQGWTGTEPLASEFQEPHKEIVQLQWEDEMLRRQSPSLTRQQ